MRLLLQDLKSILEYERAVFGAFVPRFDTRSLEPADVRAASASRVRSDYDVVPKSPSSTGFAASEPGRKHASGEKPRSHRAPTETPSSAKETDAMSADDLFSPTAPSPRNQSRSPYERIHALIPDDSPLRRLQTLEEAEDYVRSTVLIPLDKTRRNAVFGVGSPTADIMVIGEAPGADEDEQGEPFVGRAGQLLTKILKAIGFEREDVYIANILKSRPPNNRDPLAAEVEAHVPILYKQIAIIQPKLILCVGRTSGTTLLNKRTSLGALRQKFHDWHGLPVLVTYHPAALLRNPNWKKPTWDDVQLLRKRYDELVEAPEAA